MLTAQFFRFFRHLSWAVFVVGSGYLLTGCNKDTDPDDQISVGNRLRGTVHFDNPATLALDTAYRARVSIYRDGHPEEATVLPLNRGGFEALNLANTTYTLVGRVDIKHEDGQPYVTYVGLKEGLSAGRGGNSDDIRFDLHRDSGNPQPTLLRMVVKDSDGHVRPNARVCLYPSLAAVNLNFRKCAGSLRSGITNRKGIILFVGLEPTQGYYGGALAPNGADSLTNVGTATPLATITGVSATTVVQSNLVVSKRTYSAPPAGPPGLKITITDPTNYVLPGAVVCLYPRAITAADTTCTTSLRSDTTNLQGQVTFAGLQANTVYYLAAKRKVGSVVYTNLTSLNQATTGNAGSGNLPITIKLQ